MRVTLKDIARHTGLSVATVSLVLNNKPHRLSAETCDKVLKTAEMLGYRPNRLAKGLVTNKTKTIGLILPDIANSYFTTIAEHIQTQCMNAGYNMFLCNTNDDPDKDLTYVNALLDCGVDGIVLIFASTATRNCAIECEQIMRKADKPLVFIDRTLPGLSSHIVSTDNELGGYLATQHLISLGHKKIGCITGPMFLHSSKQRFYGYIRALQEAGIPFDSSLVQESNFQILSDYSKLENLLAKQVTAIFAYNDLIAYGTYQQAVQHGLSVPGDFSLIGFDDLLFSKLMAVPLTTIAQPVKDMSEAAIALLLELIENTTEFPQKDITFSPHLVIRSSTSNLS